MLIESDLFIAYLKKEDWLKPTAEKIFNAIKTNTLQDIQASTDIIHELYYVFSDIAPIPTILGNAANLATLENITYIDPTREILLSALDLMTSYDLKSIFDAIYAATSLTPHVPDHTILSTDQAYDKISGIERIDPRNLQIPE
ncbi:VapC toxin family PIN domain ribonuclease [Candidatus Bathyarchaeota archaeon]|nr:VapC toxin family PIN domain ribonuclease [Candidatus Bathyarchaeota archaeon]